MTGRRSLGGHNDWSEDYGVNPRFVNSAKGVSVQKTIVLWPDAFAVN